MMLRRKITVLSKIIRFKFPLFVIILAALAGCVSAPVSPTDLPDQITSPATSLPDQDEPVASATSLPETATITFWEWRGGSLAEFMESEADLFHERYPWITVEVLQFPDRRAYREALALAFESEDAPDVFIRPHSLARMVDDGWVQPIDTWITPEWVASFPEGSFSETRNVWQGKIYAYPVFAEGSPRMLFLNCELFRQAGLVDAAGEILTPKTWGELRSMAAQITQAGAGEFYGIGIGIKDARPMSWWADLAALAGAPMTPYDFDFHTGQYVYGSHPGYAQIVELLLGMKADGSVYPYEGTLDDSNIYSYFGQGKFAIFMSGSYVVSNLLLDFPDFQDYQVAPLPVPDDGQTGDIVLLPGTGVYYMSSHCEDPDEAWLWLEWLSSRETHQRMVSQSSNFSVFEDLNTAENISDEKVLQAYQAQSAFGVYGPFPPARNPDTALVMPEAVVPEIGDLLIGIYTGQIEDWRQALTDLDAAKQSALDAAIQDAIAAGADVSLEDFIFTDWVPTENYVTVSEP
jgi:multiple sugar transport system substrate-binding protein